MVWHTDDIIFCFSGEILFGYFRNTFSVYGLCVSANEYFPRFLGILFLYVDFAFLRMNTFRGFSE